jgi:glycosyltransferase involved in cell wall biosynthesis
LRYGGTERVVAAVVAELVALGHDVTLYASGDSVTEARLIPIVERALWRATSPTSDLVVHVSELARVVREAPDFDVIHSHVDVLGFAFARLTRTPFIHTMHGRLDLPELQPLGAEFRDAALVSISNSQRGPLPNANWVATVYNGVPIDSLPVGDGAGKYLAFVGRISPEKGIADAIDVAIRAGIPLKIAARMPLESVDNQWVARDWTYYKEEVKPRMDHPLIEFVGEVDDEEKGALLKDALGLLFPINWPEPFGLAMTEALACGTPVIARAMGSAPEIIEHGRTGFLCNEIDEMVAACHRLGEIDRYECRRVVEQRYSARAMALGYLDVYQRMIECAAPVGARLAALQTLKVS